jgi:cytochrome bd ubiquinol oxidase subunit I
LAIPRLGSIITRESLNKPVPGLDAVPATDRPPVNITHVSFQVMAGAGLLLAASVILYFLAQRRGHDLLANRWYLRFAVFAGPLAVLALECGWITTEVGRQPWTVWQVLRTNDAVNVSSGLWASLTGVAIIYLGMTVGAYIVLTSMASRWRAGEEELPSPYGPTPTARAAVSADARTASSP